MRYRNDSIVSHKDGEPVDAELFAHTRRKQDRFDALNQRISEAYVDVAAEEGVAEIDSLVKRERARRWRHG